MGDESLAGSVIFGYRHVSGVPLCPCRDPGNYMMLEQPGDDPLDVQFRCWCGATMRCAFDTAEERADFVRAHSGEPDTTDERPLIPEATDGV